ncbi:inorganic phosphate transporter [Pseudomonas sp. RIT-PI-S]|uniref:inorganic phosphate transporter n=1 Tax=Pseudomonas sp. RIT-PI-S TaxID=3035295 RepID=UPI0021D849F9|nr:inorganic phosphate transporter [Pseudomonas sp. RIT-PI-S]
MTSNTFRASAPAKGPALDRRSTPLVKALFYAVLIVGVSYMFWSLGRDLDTSNASTATWTPYVLLGVALVIALAFEFVNGFHDTANAVATVIYTHSLPAHVAVMWSGAFNFIGVLTSSGAVAFGIIALLPVDLILQVGSSAGFAMIFALLLAAILWNLGTWSLGLPASSSHTLIGSIIGVGVANALMSGRTGTSGVDWGQAAKVGYALLLSPVIGFVCAGALMLLLRRLVKNRALYQAPEGNNPPPFWIRGLLILTCTGVSFAHGSNDGQKGMGLIMLILIGTLPMAYALNRAIPEPETQRFAALAVVTQQALTRAEPQPLTVEPRKHLENFLIDHKPSPQLVPALAAVAGSIAEQVKLYGSLDRVPPRASSNVRNDMYLTSEAIRVMEKEKIGTFDADTRDKLKAFQAYIGEATRFIPPWVKVAVALALGMGTLVGWRRIVVTVGERIGKTHLTYAQGASAETIAMLTIAAADMYGLPVSTTHVLSSGVAGTMAANGSGLQMRTVRNLLMAWVLTLPAAIVLSAGLYWLFRQFV